MGRRLNQEAAKARRDFTINAMAIQLNAKQFGDFLDPFNGKNDLENKVIKTPLDPNSTFSDDPLRMMRAVRFANQLNFSIESTTLEAIKNNAERNKRPKNSTICILIFFYKFF